MRSKRKVDNPLISNQSQSIYFCANCAIACTKDDPVNGNKRAKTTDDETYCVQEIVLEVNKQEPYKKQEKISIKTALSIIYKLNIVNELNLDGSEKSSTAASAQIEDETIVLCRNCCQVLKSMYVLYDTFEFLRKQDSYLARKVGQLDELLSQLQETWNMDKLEAEEKKSDQHSVMKTCDNETNAIQDDVLMVKEEHNFSHSSFVNSSGSSQLDSYTVQKHRADNEQQQHLNSQPSSSSSSFLHGSGSSMERRILEDIKAISTRNLHQTVGGHHFYSFDDDNEDFVDESEDDPFQLSIAEPNIYDNHSTNKEQMVAAKIIPEMKPGHHVDDVIIGLVNESGHSGPYLPYNNVTASSSLHRAAVEDVEYDGDGIPVGRCNNCFKTFVYTTHLEGHLKHCRPLNERRVSEPRPIVVDDKVEVTKVQEESQAETDEYDYESDISMDPTGLQISLRGHSSRPRRVAKIKVLDGCPICSGIKFDSPTEFAQHLLDHHDFQRSRKTFTCLLCEGSSFKMFAGLKTHLLGHAGDFRYGCPVPQCGRKFLTKQQAEIHSIRHCQRQNVIKTSMITFEQQPTKRGSNDNVKSPTPTPKAAHQNLNRSRRTHIEVYDSCPLCPNQTVFDSSVDLTNHFWLYHRPAKAGGACLFCQKIITATNLKTHLRAHAGDLPHGCPVPQCGRKFLTKQQAEIHSIRHCQTSLSSP